MSRARHPDGAAPDLQRSGAVGGVRSVVEVLAGQCPRGESLLAGQPPHLQRGMPFTRAMTQSSGMSGQPDPVHAVTRAIAMIATSIARSLRAERKAAPLSEPPW